MTNSLLNKRQTESSNSFHSSLACMTAVLSSHAAICPTTSLRQRRDLKNNAREWGKWDCAGCVREMGLLQCSGVEFARKYRYYENMAPLCGVA